MRALAAEKGARRLLPDSGGRTGRRSDPLPADPVRPSGQRDQVHRARRGRAGDRARGGRVRFKVSDTGEGLSAKDQAAVFVAFRQVDGADVRKAAGTGLGLGVAQRLAEAQGGRITVESRPGRAAPSRATGLGGPPPSPRKLQRFRKQWRSWLC
ncbi:ATP-binding protein [Tranquillimonas alkanivorans]|uniref:ATP-binding protein n=1 Tax=Tranquillimonas alkanivorans TaxID=441119 RepID=UPI000B8533D7|nr:ATP-binding protein [Tranquillimonas alkanivorans]